MLPTHPISLEICIDDAFGLNASIAGGADRVELCSALALGGLTPSHGLMLLAAKSSITAFPIIRPRAGDFLFSADEIEIMQDDILFAREIGMKGVVIGANNADNTLDAKLLEKLIKTADGMSVSLHRAFDMTPDFNAAIDTAVDLGFDRILTSGGKANVNEGLDALKSIVDHAAGRISIMPGGGVNIQNIQSIISSLGVHEIHSSGSIPYTSENEIGLTLGFETIGRRITDAPTIASLKAALR